MQIFLVGLNLSSLADGFENANPFFQSWINIIQICNYREKTFLTQISIISMSDMQPVTDVTECFRSPQHHTLLKMSNTHTCWSQTWDMLSRLILRVKEWIWYVLQCLSMTQICNLQTNLKYIRSVSSIWRQICCFLSCHLIFQLSIRRGLKNHREFGILKISEKIVTSCFQEAI